MSVCFYKSEYFQKVYNNSDHLQSAASLCD